MDKKNKTPEILLRALRQYSHNNGKGLLAGFDYNETVKIVQELSKKVDTLEKAIKSIIETWDENDGFIMDSDDIHKILKKLIQK